LRRENLIFMAIALDIAQAPAEAAVARMKSTLY
jgi:hypothetical protein